MNRLNGISGRGGAASGEERHRSDGRNLPLDQGTANKL
jgi:hypothetical protein